MTEGKARRTGGGKDGDGLKMTERLQQVKGQRVLVVTLEKGAADGWGFWYWCTPRAGRRHGEEMKLKSKVIRGPSSLLIFI